MVEEKIVGFVAAYFFEAILPIQTTVVSLPNLPQVVLYHLEYLRHKNSRVGDTVLGPEMLPHSEESSCLLHQHSWGRIVFPQEQQISVKRQRMNLLCVHICALLCLHLLSLGTGHQGMRRFGRSDNQAKLTGLMKRALQTYYGWI